MKKIVFSAVAIVSIVIVLATLFVYVKDKENEVDRAEKRANDAEEKTKDLHKKQAEAPLILLAPGGRCPYNSAESVMTKLEERLDNDPVRKKSNAIIEVQPNTCGVGDKPLTLNLDINPKATNTIYSKYIGKKYNKHCPVILIGHSIGAAYMYDLAKRLHPRILVTLDTVYEKSSVPKPSTKTDWIHIYSEEDTEYELPWFLPDIPLPDWNDQPNANYSKGIPDTDKSRNSIEDIEGSDHYHIVEMYQEAERFVHEALNDRSDCNDNETVESSTAKECSDKWNNAWFWHRANSSDVTRCLHAGADPNAGDKKGKTPLHWAVRWGGTVADVKTLLKAGADPNAYDDKGRTPLHEAAGRSSVGTVKALIGAGAELNREDKRGKTPLHKAAREIDATNLRALLKAGANPNVRDRDGNTPLHYAVEDGYAETIRALIDTRTSLNTFVEYGWNICGTRDLMPCLVDFVKNIFGAGPDLEAQNNKGRTALHKAVRNNHNAAKSEGVKILLDAGANPNVLDEDGVTPLWDAVDTGSAADIVKALLEAGADTNLDIPGGEWTPLFLAVNKGDAETVKALLDAGADPNVLDKDGVTTLLHKAARHNTAEIVRILLEAGADPKVRTKDGKLPADFAEGNADVRNDPVFQRLSDVR